MGKRRKKRRIIYSPVKAGNSLYRKKEKVYEEYEIKTNKQPILNGIALGTKVGNGKVKVISDVSKIGEFQKGEVLVTKMTDPDWVPVMRLASAIVTNEGGKTCHAAIVAGNWEFRQLSEPKRHQIIKNRKYCYS